MASRGWYMGGLRCMSRQKKSFEVIHNIPSPYRLHLFRVLNRQLSERGFDFHVHFMAFGHGDRPSNWTAGLKGVGFPHSFWRDYPLRGHYHFNPGLLRYLGSRERDYLLVGGPWDTFTGIFSSFVARRRTAIGWYETNTASPGGVSGPRGAIKRALLRQYHYLALPGQEGCKHLRLLGGHRVNRMKCVFLPNIVDETQFIAKDKLAATLKAETREMLGIPEADKVALWPARLMPAKGIVEFLAAVEPETLKGWRVVLLGQGPLQDQVEKVIQERRLQDRVLLRGYVSYEEMPRLYASSTMFLLPSIRDNNPLSVVEAMFAGLPILISNRIGNLPEALRPGVNGWSLDPCDPIDVKRVTREAFGASTDALGHMGRESIEIARSFWSSERAVATFLDSIGAGSLP